MFHMPVTKQWIISDEGKAFRFKVGQVLLKHFNNKRLTVVTEKCLLMASLVDKCSSYKSLIKPNGRLNKSVYRMLIARADALGYPEYNKGRAQEVSYFH